MRFGTLRTRTRATTLLHPSRLRALEAFQDPSYRRIWASNFTSYVIRWMETIVLGWLVLRLTDSPFQVALVGFYRTVPMLLGPLAGTMADRFDRKRVVLAAQSVSLLVAVAMASLMLTGRIEVWHIALGTLLVGLAWTMDFPSRRSFIMDIVGSQRITNAMGLDTISHAASKVVGPVVAGVMIGVVGEGWCYVFIAFLYAIGLLFLTSVRADVKRIPSVREPILRNMAQGLSYAARNRAILGVLAVTVVMNLLFFPYSQLISVIARDVLEVGPSLMGLLGSADGMGALIGAVVVVSMSLAYKGHGRVFLVGSIGAMAILLIFSRSELYFLSLALLFLTGVALSGFSTMQSTIILLSASPEMRGRTVGSLGLAIGAMPLGTLLMGAIANTLGVPAAVAISASIGLVALVAVARFLPELLRNLPQAQESKSRST